MQRHQAHFLGARIVRLVFAYGPAWNPAAPQSGKNNRVLGLGTSQYRDVPEPNVLSFTVAASTGIHREQARASHELLDPNHDLFCLTVRCETGNDLNSGARPFAGQCWTFSENRGRDLQDRLCEPVGCREPDDLSILVRLREPREMARASTSKSIDRLVRITDDAQTPTVLCHQTDQRCLHVIDVLVLIDANAAVATANSLGQLLALRKELNRPNDQIIDVQEIPSSKEMLIAVEREQ
jgi:hypothetical protein